MPNLNEMSTWAFENHANRVLNRLYRMGWDADQVRRVAYRCAMAAKSGAAQALWCEIDTQSRA